MIKKQKIMNYNKMIIIVIMNYNKMIIIVIIIMNSKWI